MSHYLLSAETSFSAAHTLPGVDKCEKLHGHNWKVRLTIRVDDANLDATGMGVDFRIIEQVARDAVSDFDHGYLNDLEPFKSRIPTAENIARIVSERAASALRHRGLRTKVNEVEVWETPGYRVTYRTE